MCPELFWKKVDKTAGENACWPWKGCTNRAGYGVTSVNRKFTASHRQAYIYGIGQIPDGMCVCHRCDVPGCCNPSHLFLGTNADNTADKIAKNRQSKGEKHSKALMPNRPRGSNNAMSRFTEEQVAEMRRLRRETRMTIKEIAAKFGGSYGGVCKAIRGNGWYHVKEPIPEPRPFTKHTSEIIDAVRAARATGKTVKQIAQDFGLSIWATNNIVYKRTWRD